VLLCQRNVLLPRFIEGSSYDVTPASLEAQGKLVKSEVDSKLAFRATH
jgi:hypothetical protein